MNSHITFLLFFLITLTIEHSNGEIQCIDEETNATIPDFSSFETNGRMKLFTNVLNISCHNENNNFTLPNEKLSLTHFINNIAGFDIKKSKFVSNAATNFVFLTIEFTFTYFDFYSKSKQDHQISVDISSSQSIMKSLDDDKKPFKIESIFSNVRMTLRFGANVLFRTRMSRILFKDANINAMVICKLTNTSLRRNLFQIVQNDDLFRFSEEDESSLKLNRSLFLIHLNSTVNSTMLDETYKLFLSDHILDRVVFIAMKHISIYWTLRGVAGVTV